MKSPVSSPRTNEFSLNGSIKSTSTLPNHSDVIENIASSNASQQDKSSHGDHPKNTNVEMEAKGNELEMAANVENQDNVQDANVPEPYVHSLLKWPSGRTWVTKVWIANLLLVRDAAEDNNMSSVIYILMSAC